VSSIGKFWSGLLSLVANASIIFFANEIFEGFRAQITLAYIAIATVGFAFGFALRMRPELFFWVSIFSAVLASMPILLITYGMALMRIHYVLLYGALGFAGCWLGIAVARRCRAERP
jgi:hypothetical protein